MLSVTNKPFMLSVITMNVVMLSVVMMNVVAPVYLLRLKHSVVKFLRDKNIASYK